MKKFLSLLTAAVLFVSVFPAVSFAEDAEAGEVPLTEAVYSADFEGVLTIEEYDAKMAQIEA